MPNSQKPKFDVLITTYELVNKETSQLRKFDWELLIVDEGHRLKNSESKLFVALTRQWKARHRLLLTGTPLQNNLSELFNLLVFVEPEKYRFEDLQDQYASVQEKEIVAKLHDMLRPHILRRMKNEVLKDMIPDKVRAPS
jgi:chromodomain-helicase-DNA-binding protein 4